MGAAAAEADRTLFVGNLEPRVTEELLFELFHQAGPVIKVKIPRDRDGKAKQFAFVNFKHEESVPYGMSLLNGIKLFGRPIKIQFRSGSSHASHDGSSPHGAASAPGAARYERSPDHMVAAGLMPVQRSPDHLPRQAMLGSGAWPPPPFGYPPAPLLRRAEGPAAPRKPRLGAHPYFAEGRHAAREPRFADYGRPKRDDYAYDERSAEPHYRAPRDEGGYGDRLRDGWSHDYDGRRDAYRDGRWCPARH